MHENPKNAHKNVQKSSKNFKPSIHNVVSTGTNIFAKIWLSMCLLAVLGSQGIVVKCTAAIFFRTVDYKQVYGKLMLKELDVLKVNVSFNAIIAPRNCSKQRVVGRHRKN